jgi:hypothetical protein
MPKARVAKAAKNEERSEVVKRGKQRVRAAAQDASVGPSYWH